MRRAPACSGDSRTSSGAAWSEHNGWQADEEGRQEAETGHKEGRRQASRGEADPPVGRQPPDREGRRRRSRAGLHRGHAGLEERSREALDALIVRTVPGVRKAVKWNSPFYGVDGQGWFLAFHCFTKYVKVTFFRGRSGVQGPHSRRCRVQRRETEEVGTPFSP
jgi:hypothetical protein